MQSLSFYSQIAWISPSYESHGWSARDAGLLLSLWSIAQLVSGLGGPALADRVRDRRPLVAAAVASNIAGLVGLVLAPTAAPVLWIVLLALGPGRRLRPRPGEAGRLRPSPAASARLSALVFLVSYSTASLGPFVFGAVHDATDGFTAPYAVLLGVAVVQLSLVPRLRPGRLTEGAGRMSA